ncbi:MAG: hypothetical protein LUC38_05425 [Oscillospiraceae bacterium]|nr:hypothetical protein [Oscillospiraceae bacterium]
MVTITQTVDLSLTESLIPTIIHAKQYDNMGRKVVCSVYQGSTFVILDSDTIINISGTRPDGEIFQYSSETNSDVVCVEDGKASIWLTSVMTGVAGRTAIDVTVIDGNGSALGSFAFVLKVEKASLGSPELSTGSYTGLVSRLASNIVDCYIDDNGYLVIVSEDGLGLNFEMDDEGNVSINYEGGSNA